MNTDKIYAEQIANQYSEKKEDKVVLLKNLDAAVKKTAMILALSVGTITALILGVGMCLAMRIIGPNNVISMVLGIIIGVVGIAGMVANYPLYKKVLASRKKKYGSEILNLANEISEENK